MQLKKFTQHITTGLFAIALLCSVPSFAQEEDLLSLLGEDETTDYATATFKTTRVINMHSVENVARGVMDFRISHRFGFLNTGAYEFFGLDGATLRLGFEYGVSDRLMLGLGRSSNNKAFDGLVKFKLLRQSTGKKKMPISVSLFSSIVLNTLRWAEPERENFFSSRLFYTHQILIARKFNDGLSLQFTPTLVHRNLVETAAEKNDVIAFGIGGRQKLTKRTSINAEYFYVLPNQLAERYTNSLSLGFDIETGGHVFQLHFTNSTGMVEPTFVTETVGEWLNGDVHFGFNVSRVFTIKERKQPENL
jgi:hypothetical protein